MRPIRTAGSLDRMEAALFLEALAANMRLGNVDVQSVFEGLEITSQDLDGFQVYVKGQIQRYSIDDTVSKAKTIFYEKHKIQGPWIDALIEEAYYRIENYFDDNDNLVEDAIEKYFTAELVCDVAHSLWLSDYVLDNDSIYETVSDTIPDILPSEAYIEED